MYYYFMIWELSYKFFKYFIENKRAFYKYFILSFIVGLLELTGVAITYPFVSRLLSQDQLTAKTALLGGIIILAFLTKNLFMIFYSALQISFTKVCEEVTDIGNGFVMDDYILEYEVK